LYASLVAALLSSLFIPLIILYAQRMGLFDKSNERKIHSGDIPRLGGFGIFLAAVITIIILALVFYRRGVFETSFLPYLPVLISLGLIHITGLIDDLKNLRALGKFLVQFLCALAIAVFGFRL
ncbi:MAG: undecaprenyl/decaprenyl-phosphate alpha-N-acetylglucosaminyl 1-phosphate transferase, partial [Afipia sp.]|nr:undecaprenyl/decaprenyl-phosphate alpha-N-acetylglucosaminyl 1-phosphate transferase [Afipia sp.]